MTSKISQTLENQKKKNLILHSKLYVNLLRYYSLFFVVLMLYSAFFAQFDVSEHQIAYPLLFMGIIGFFYGLIVVKTNMVNRLKIGLWIYFPSNYMFSGALSKNAYKYWISKSIIVVYGKKARIIGILCSIICAITVVSCLLVIN